MIERSFQIQGRTVFLSISETNDEFVRLSNLTQETRYYAANFRKTGLYLVAEHKTDTVIGIITCLNGPLEVSAQDQEKIERLIAELTIFASDVFEAISKLFAETH